MEHKLPALPYAKDSLAPNISAETLEYHYGKHHKTYVDNLNKLILGTEFEKMSLEEIIKKSSSGVFNNAAQIWNHTFYWNCLSPQGGGEPSGTVASIIAKNFGSFVQFKEKFTSAAMTLFGSGWTWLIKNPDSSLTIEAASNAGNFLRENKTPILTCDLWEHAYYIDYRNARAKYLEAFWNLVNWKYAEQNIK